MIDLKKLRELETKATQGPWRGCLHVRDHTHDHHCPCNQATIWSEPADTIVVEKYENRDGSGPPPVSREEELANMSFIVETRNQVPELLQWIERAATIFRADCENGYHDERKDLLEELDASLVRCRACG